VRIIVLNRIAEHPRNAAWELFASERDRMRQGLEHYRARHRGSASRGHRELLEHLYLIYRREAPTMAYTMEQFIRDTHRMVIEDAIQHDPESILKHFAPEQRLEGLDPEFIKEWLGKQRQDH
jgi:hypothetical protein